MTIDDVRAMDRAMFVERVGWVFEHSPWVAERAWDGRPFASVEHLHTTMVDAMRAAGHDEQLALVRAHPDLGARARMSDASTSEQAGAGLTTLTRHQFDALQELNDAYKAKFGFPFLFAVKGSTPDHILASMRERLPRDVETEFEEALTQVSRIARFRLDDLVGGTDDARDARG